MILQRIASRNFSKSSQFRCSNKLKDLLDSAVGGDKTPNHQADRWSTSPYPEGTVFDSRDQSKKEKRSSKDPRETSVILFPGQGAQYVGMAKGLLKIPEARDMFQIAKEVLG